MNTLLHTHGAEHANIWRGIFEEVFLGGLIDTLKILPFLFVTYLLMELIEHKASAKARSFMERSGAAGPAVGGLLGAIPQCGFSASAANFYTGRVISLGMLISIFLSTSDEMLPIMVSGKISAGAILAILGYKAAVGIFVGFTVDIVLKLIRGKREPINIDRICEEDDCHCENGVLFSAIHHTVTVGAFVLIITMLINLLVLLVGTESIAGVMYDKPFISHLIAAVIGLIPNCAVSVALTDFCLEGFITAGTMLAGLFSGAGVGVLVLFKVNKDYREIFAVMGILVLSGFVFGLLADVLNFSALL